jgi:CubicO group peptidase (beta-lactamase class C family)
MKSRSFYSILFVLFSVTSFAQEQKFLALDSLFQILDENNRFMGSLSISENGKIIYSKTIGKVDLASGKSSDNLTKYRIGSISKMFTACLIFQAIEENKLSLKQNINRFFPKITGAKEISIGNLLNHRSGIHNYTNDTSYFNYYTASKSQKEMLEIIQASGSDFKPNSKAEYSNSNYILLSFILEKIYKKSYEELLDIKIIQPQGLKNTYFGKKLELAKNECASYRFSGKWELENETHSSVSLGAGGIVSTTEDLLFFITKLFEGKIINTASLAQMMKLEDGFGMGIFSVPFYDKKGFGHTGGIDGFSSFLYTFPEEKISIALTSNGSRFNNNDIGIAALSDCFDKSFSLPSFYAGALTSKDLDKYLGTYSNPEMPIKIRITKDSLSLIGQATGQPSFTLETIGKDSFEFSPAGVEIQFIPEKNLLILKQGGGEFTFLKFK